MIYNNGYLSMVVPIAFCQLFLGERVETCLPAGGRKRRKVVIRQGGMA
jgi:hypothetical protein